MDPLVQVVTLELNNTQPADITIDPIPYSPYDPFQEKVEKTCELLQGALSLAERLLATRSISDYYKRVLIQVYDLFSTYGIEAIYRTRISSSRNSFNIPSWYLLLMGARK
ncbi:hypothetical protein F8M41_021245 [Gigaspora margarita]|uniref:Uncharacterized protein n=1 Tax=Gigaspora margarita TaxID=4874 RepID=A0A8H4AH95_GIGMA|nr:hypothetical protein F8M41_021245 [Gigaspora margarita]